MAGFRHVKFVFAHCCVGHLHQHTYRECQHHRIHFRDCLGVRIILGCSWIIPGGKPQTAGRYHHLVAAIVFLSFGIITSFLCLVVDGVFILLTIDMRPMKAGRCQFYTSGNSYIYENYYATVPCQGLTESCSLKVRSGTCYCCDLYDCANGGYLDNFYEFVGVQSCQEVLSLYVLLWVLTCLQLLAFIVGILTTAVLGSIKDMKSGVACPDVSQWGGSSLLSFEGGNCFSPTAPLLMDPNSHTGAQLYPRASLYVSPAAQTPAESSVPQRTSSDTSHTQPNPPPFAPLYNLLPYKTSSFTA
ncbi:transmembrane protein 255B isoform X2 [Myxocyprinus asiaticus]|uniref:transmembrane protein 255B isoform X2 n=1 Tax=Myxocyprinus asiaticus TaxID=70543 RepID=UPI0022229BCC|nr:transmembrane protein 255B isoform X2 [Myxocyprinus asiaticus]